MTRQRRSRLLIQTVMATIVATATTAHAVVNCSTPISVSGGNYTMNDNYETTGTCFQISGGYDLNMNGYAITCTNGSGCGNAVEGLNTNTAGTDVYNGAIFGPFYAGVSGKIEEVRSVLIDDAFVGINLTGLTKHIWKNVLLNIESIGIYATFTGASSDSIDNNYVSMRNINTGATAIVPNGGPSSGTGSKIEKNYIEGYNIGININDNKKYRVTDNFINSNGDIDWPFQPYSDGWVPSGTTLSGNLCFDHSVCPVPAAPFFLP